MKHIVDEDSLHEAMKMGKHGIELSSVREEVASRQAAALASGVSIYYQLDGRLVEERPDRRILDRASQAIQPKPRDRSKLSSVK
jgi:hypothetical protein